ncbi:unnamed protein product [Onchocerca ochengi]|nr:unnamed protein product [Onchocerca ochengi]
MKGQNARDKGPASERQKINKEEAERAPLPISDDEAEDWPTRLNGRKQLASRFCCTTSAGSFPASRCWKSSERIPQELDTAKGRCVHGGLH